MTPVEAIAVEVVVETKAACPDRARAQAALVDALANARAPKRSTKNGAASWRVDVAVEVEEGARPVRSATARIVDDRGTVVAERTVSDRSACAPLTRAIGAWASLVLDDELARARDAADTPLPVPAPAASDASPPLTRTDRVPGADETNDLERTTTTTNRRSTVEVGLMGYVRDGLASTSGFAGGSGFLAIEVAPSWFLRPSVFYGTSTVQVATTESARSSFSHFALRADFCRRIPGNYIERRGLELDLCAGADVSEIYTEGSRGEDLWMTRASVGPAAAFRGEIGDNTNLELRFASGYNFNRRAVLKEEEPAPLFAQAEVGLSWRFR